jgi:hypothetical protein
MRATYQFRHQFLGLGTGGPGARRHPGRQTLPAAQGEVNPAASCRCSSPSRRGDLLTSPPGGDQGADPRFRSPSGRARGGATAAPVRRRRSASRSCRGPPRPWPLLHGDPTTAGDPVDPRQLRPNVAEGRKLLWLSPATRRLLRADGFVGAARLSRVIASSAVRVSGMWSGHRKSPRRRGFLGASRAAGGPPGGPREHDQ